MRAVNLLPSESLRAPRPQAAPIAVAAAVSGLVVVLALAGGNLLESSRIASAQKMLNQAKVAQAATPLPPSTPAVTPPPTAVATQMQPRLAAVTETLSSRIAWDRILREFSLVLPSDVQVNSLNLSQAGADASSSSSSSSSTPSAPSGAGGLSLAGVTYSYDSVARLVARMDLVPDLTNVELTQTSADNGVVQFTINAVVKGAAPTTPITTPAEPTATPTTTTPTS